MATSRGILYAMSRIAALLIALTVSASAATLEVKLKAGSIRPVTLDSPVDDSNFRDPRGYANHGTVAHHFTKRISILNTGDETLTGRLLVVNGRDWTNADAFASGLHLSAEPGRQGESMMRLFTFWNDHRSHAGSWSKLADEPFAALNFWGYTLCGEDTQSLARLAHTIDVPARHVQLNGHIAAEYRYDGAWHMIDGDQNACYLKLDNKTLASADELRADPFLIFRTRILGKHAPLLAAASACNSSLIEHVQPGEPKQIKLKTGPAPLNTFTLVPGESLTWLCDTPPEKIAGKTDTEKPDALRAAALATIEHRVMVKGRTIAKDSTISVHSPHPIVKAVNVTTGMIFQPKDGDVIFNATIPVKDEGDQVSVFSQCSQVSLPLLSRGDNTLLLDSGKGEARFTMEYDPQPKTVIPDAMLTAREAAGEGTPAFAIVANPTAEELWWQVSEMRDFGFVAPSLEGVVPFAVHLRFDPLTDTFLSPGRTYFIRAKVKLGNVWGRWSEPLEFRVTKPRQPTGLKFSEPRSGRVRLTWDSGAKDAEFLVFGSNRIDFVPEVFAGEEIVALNHLTATEQRPNKNLIATVKAHEVEFAPEHRFYRVIARRHDVLSVPSGLARIPDEMAGKLPPAMVLQTRATKAGRKDVYRAKEMPLGAGEPSGK